MDATSFTALELGLLSKLNRADNTIKLYEKEAQQYGHDSSEHKIWQEAIRIYNIAYTELTYYRSEYRGTEPRSIVQND